MDKHSEELHRLMKDPENKICIDCGSSAQWASVNNSVYLCLNCAGMHRGLGVNISFVRSITMDKWDAKQIKLMKIGGNRRFKVLMKEFNISDDIEIGMKYKLKAIDYYRKLLRAEAFNEDMPERPENKSAFELIETFKQCKEVTNTNFISSQGNSYQDNNNNKEESSFFNSVGTFFENKVHDLQNGIKEMKIGKKTGDLSKKAVNYMGEKTSEVINSSFVQSIYKKSKELLKGKSDDRNEDQRQPAFNNNINGDNDKANSNDDNYSNDIIEINSMNSYSNNNMNQNEYKSNYHNQSQSKSETSKPNQNIYDFFSPPDTMKKQNKQKEKDDLFNEIFGNDSPSISMNLKEEKKGTDKQHQDIPMDLFDK